MRSLPFSRAVGTLLCTVGLCAVVAAHAASVATDPALPLLDVAFCATPSADVAGGSLFVSSSADCSAAVAFPQAGCPDGSYAFTVTGASLNIDVTLPTIAVPAAYWCAASGRGGAVAVATLAMHAVQPAPLFYFLGTSWTVRLDNATPVGTTLGLYYDATCQTAIEPYGSVAVTEERTMTFSTTATVANLCGMVPSVVSGASGTAMTWRNRLMSAAPYAVTPATAVRHTTATVRVARNRAFYCALSNSSTCSDLPPRGASQANGDGSLSLAVTEPAGTYYFCSAQGDDIYVPASGTFTVVEYGVQPSVGYVGSRTAVHPALNATASMQVALFASPGCSGAAVQDWADFRAAAWTVDTAGTYHACVRASPSTPPSEYVPAGEFRVVLAPTLTPAQRVAVRSFDYELVLTARDAATASARFSLGLSAQADCSSLYREVTVADGQTARIAVGADAAATLHWCLSLPLSSHTPDGGVASAVSYAVLGSVPVRDYQVSHEPLRVSRAATLALDSAAALAAGSSVVFLPASQHSCADVRTAAGAAVTATVARGNTLGGVVFPHAGEWVMCAAAGAGSSPETYVGLQRVSVYGDAAVLPRSVIPGLAARVTLTGLQPLQPVVVTAAGECSASAPVLASGAADRSGAATLTLTSATPTTLLVCGSYTGVADGAATSAVVQPAASILSANPRAFPAVVEVGAGTQRLRVVGGGAGALAGRAVFLAPADHVCAASTAMPPSAIVPGALRLGSDSGDVVETPLALSDNMVDTRYRVCVETSGAFVDAGTVAVTRVSLAAATAGTVALTANQHAILSFPAGYTSVALVDTYAVVDGDVDCTGDLSGATVYARGGISASSGVADAFVAPAPASGTSRSLRVCVAVSSQRVGSTYGYLDGGALSSSTFTAVSRYAQSDLRGGVAGWPVLRYASLYLVSCSGASCAAGAASRTCSAASVRYPVGATAPLSARPSTGSHLLCQSVTAGPSTTVVGSNTTVEVVSAFSMSSAADLTQLRPFVPFTATVTGGSAPSVTVVVQPLSVPCGSAAAESQSFVFAAGVPRTVTITDITPYERIHFCAKPSAAQPDAFEVMAGTLVSFVSPSHVSFPSLARSGSVTITVPTTASSQAMLARARDCTTAVSGGGATARVGGGFTFTVPPCGANSDLREVHFCELVDGALAYRGSLLLLRGGNCSANDGSASIAYTSVAPGVPVADFGVNGKYLSVAGVSRTADCRSLVQPSVAAAGYVPGADEPAVLYVCTHPVGDASVMFTTQAATLAVRHYEVTPRVARSGVSLVDGAAEQTVVRLNHALPAGTAFFSSGATCGHSVGGAAGLSSPARSAVYAGTNVCGTVSVCWQGDAAAAPVAVAQFQSVTPAAVRQATPALVRGASFSVSFEPSACAAAAAGSQPSVYLSADRCGSVLAGTAAGASLTSFTTAVPSTLLPGLSMASLCVTTSAGAVSVVPEVPVARHGVHPTTVTAGARDVAFFAPTYAGASLWFSTAADNCSAASALTTSLPRFTVGEDGYGAASIVRPGEAALAAGEYLLCSAAGSVVDTVRVVPAVFFDVRGTSFVAGVTGPMTLLGDLRAADLREGFSTTADCRAPSTAYGAWTRVSDTVVNVTAAAAYGGSLYLCAWVAQNRTVVAVPNAWSAGGRSITFAGATLALPSSGLDVCTAYSLDQCAAPRSSGGDSGNMLTVVYGDCCSRADQASAVGSGAMVGGTCALTFDAAAVRQHAVDAVYSVCAWNPSDLAVCATLGYTALGTNCGGAVDNTPGSGATSGHGVVVGAVVAGVVGGVAVVAGACFLVWYCRCRKAGKGSQPGDAEARDVGVSCASSDAESVSWEQAMSLNIPPAGNNYGSKARIGVHSSPARMRHDVLSQVGGAASEAGLESALGEQLDTNFMDGCRELTRRYRDFVRGRACAEGGSACDFPVAALVPRGEADGGARFQITDGASAEVAAADFRPACLARGRCSKPLVFAGDDVPMAEAFRELYAQQGLARNAIEIGESTAFFNLRVLAKSHAAMLAEKAAAGQAAVSTGCWFSDGERSVFGAAATAEGGTPRASTAVAQARQWLYDHRGELEFPWVTNSFRTLVGYSSRDAASYDYVDWGLPLVDLQAFHPLHRWWSPLLPRVTRSAADDSDPRFAFMHAESTVPFVKRYFMLFQVEHEERVAVEAAEAEGTFALMQLHSDAWRRFGKPPSCVNPLSRSAASLHNKAASLGSQEFYTAGLSGGTAPGDCSLSDYVPFRSYHDSSLQLGAPPRVLGH